MACCVLMAVLLQWGYRLTGRGPASVQRPERPVRPGLVVAAVLELMAVLGLIVLLSAGAGSAGMSHGHARAGTDGWAITAAAAFIALAALGAAVLDAGRRAIPGLVLIGGAGGWWLATGPGHDHAAMMLKVELILVLGPALLADGLVPPGVARPRRRVLAVPILAAAAMGAVMGGLHVGVVHAAAATSATARAWLLVAMLAAGGLLWGVVLRRDRHSASVRLLTLSAGLEIGGVLALAMLVAPHPLFATDVTDQRLAGLVMLAADAMVVALVLRPELALLRRLIAPTTSSPVPVQGRKPARWPPPLPPLT
jgi:hypothetical protein